MGKKRRGGKAPSSELPDPAAAVQQLRKVVARASRLRRAVMRLERMVPGKDPGWCAVVQEVVCQEHQYGTMLHAIIAVHGMEKALDVIRSEPWSHMGLLKMDPSLYDPAGDCF
jgi:hypothetical protein